MRVLLFFPLPPDCGVHTIKMQRDGRVRGLLGTNYREGPGLWVEVDPTAPAESRAFAVVLAEEPLPSEVGEYIGMFERDQRAHHVYEQLAVQIPANLATMLPDQEAENAYRLLIKAGFTLRDDIAWQAPDDEPLTTDLMMAVAELMGNGFGSVVRS